MHATGQQYSYLIVSISVCLQLRFVNLSINEYDDDDQECCGKILAVSQL